MEIHPHTVINKVRGDNAELLIMVKTVWKDCIILSDVIVVRDTHRTKNHENNFSNDANDNEVNAYQQLFKGHIENERSSKLDEHCSIHKKYQQKVNFSLIQKRLKIDRSVQNHK